MPEPEVRPPGEPLREAVGQHPGERHRAQAQAERVEQPGGQRRRAPRPPRSRPRPARASARRAGARGSGCAGSRASSGRSATRLKPIAAQRAAENARTTSATVRGADRRHPRGGQHAEQREWQREERVRQLDEVDVADEQRLAGERLALPRAGEVTGGCPAGPQLVHPALGVRVHRDEVRPLAGESLLLPLPGGVDSHLAAVGEARGSRGRARPPGPW